MKYPFLLFFTFVLHTVCFGQSLSEKTDSIAYRLGLFDYIKQALTFSIEPMRDWLIEEDSIKIIQIEEKINDQEIYFRLRKSIQQLHSEQEIEDLYQFTTTTAFQKIFKGEEINKLMSMAFGDMFDEIKALEEKNYSKGHDNSYEFTPVPVDRPDGFYATVNYTRGMEYSQIELVKDPAITSVHIKEISKDYSIYGDKILNITLTKEGAIIFHQLTEANVDYPIAVVINKHIIYAPIVNEPISGGKVSINANFTDEELDFIIQKLSPE